MNMKFYYYDKKDLLFKKIPTDALILFGLLLVAVGSFCMQLYFIL